MSEQSIGGRDPHLSIGRGVSISGLEPGAELAATVRKIVPVYRGVRHSADEISLELLRPPSQLPFQEGERVRIKYWDEEVAYYFDTEVLKVSGSAKEHLVISRPSEALALQRRRSYRIHSPIPFSFSVIDAAEAQLIGEKVANATTGNLTVGGLAFETSLPLKVGDQLEMNLQLSPSRQVNALGWVVRSEEVEHGEKSLNSVALEFLQLEAEDQAQLLKFLIQARVSE